MENTRLLLFSIGYHACRYGTSIIISAMPVYSFNGTTPANFGRLAQIPCGHIFFLSVNSVLLLFYISKSDQKYQVIALFYIALNKYEPVKMPI